MADLLDLEARFEKEHEQRAREGWPGAWGDLPGLLELYRQLSPEQRSSVWRAGNLALTEYFVRVSPAYSEYLASVTEGSDSGTAWDAFLNRTSGDRVIFRAAVLMAIRRVRDIG